MAEGSRGSVPLPNAPRQVTADGRALCHNRRVDQRRVVVTGMGAVTSIGGDARGLLEEPARGSVRHPAVFALRRLASYRTQTAARGRRDPGRIPDARPSVGACRGRTAWVWPRRREAIAASGLDLAREDPTRIGVILGGGTSGLLDSEAFFELLPARAQGAPVEGPEPPARRDHRPRRAALRPRGHQVHDHDRLLLLGQRHGLRLRRDRGRPRRRRRDGRLGRAGAADLRRASTRCGRSIPDPCRPFDRERKGLSIGEAAGILVFEEEGRARRRGAPIVARVPAATA